MTIAGRRPPPLPPSPPSPSLSRPWPCRPVAQPIEERADVVVVAAVHGEDRIPETVIGPRIPNATPNGICISFTLTSGGSTGRSRDHQVLQRDDAEAAAAAPHRDRLSQPVRELAGDQVRGQPPTAKG